MIIEIIPIERRILRLSVSRIDIEVDGEYDTLQISLLGSYIPRQYGNRRWQKCQVFSLLFPLAMAPQF